MILGLGLKFSTDGVQSGCVFKSHTTASLTCACQAVIPPWFSVTLGSVVPGIAISYLCFIKDDTVLSCFCHPSVLLFNTVLLVISITDKVK